MRSWPMRLHRAWSPSMRREWIEMTPLPDGAPDQRHASPSMRREWIEMFHDPVSNSAVLISVSLHAEGVD